MSSRSPKTRHPRDRPQKRLDALRERRNHCAEAARAVLASAASNEVKRVALDALVRYATPGGVQRPGDLRTPGVAALDGTTPGRGAIHHEHVVPVRVLVDRMLTNDDPAEVIDVAVVAHVLREEHARIGALVTKHAALYQRMLEAPLHELPELARNRYEASGLTLHTVPSVIDPGGELG